MIALDRRTSSYPVVMPDRRLRDRPSPRRRIRRSSMAAALVMAAVAIVPALFYVFERTEAAKAGYSILHLQREIARLQSENARLHTTVSTLRSPQRIERIATSELGMVTPRQSQLAAITIAPVAAEPPALPVRRPIAQRLRAWLGITEAQAHEPAR